MLPAIVQFSESIVTHPIETVIIKEAAVSVTVGLLKQTKGNSRRCYISTRRKRHYESTEDFTEVINLKKPSFPKSTSDKNEG
jgi:hypothetical protein